MKGDDLGEKSKTEIKSIIFSTDLMLSVFKHRRDARFLSDEGSVVLIRRVLANGEQGKRLKESKAEAQSRSQGEGEGRSQGCPSQGFGGEEGGPCHCLCVASEREHHQGIDLEGFDQWKVASSVTT